MYIAEEISLSLRNMVIREPEAKDHTGKRGTKKKQGEGEIKKRVSRDRGVALESLAGESV